MRNVFEKAVRVEHRRNIYINEISNTKLNIYNAIYTYNYVQQK